VCAPVRLPKVQSTLIAGAVGVVVLWGASFFVPLSAHWDLDGRSIDVSIARSTLEIELRQSLERMVLAHAGRVGFAGFRYAHLYVGQPRIHRQLKTAHCESELEWAQEQNKRMLDEQRVWTLNGCTEVHTVSLRLGGLVLLFGVPPLTKFFLWSLRRQHRRKRGRCMQCAYLLTGNASGICPECGSPIAPRTPLGLELRRAPHVRTPRT
jgi:hypothetical protein